MRLERLWIRPAILLLATVGALWSWPPTSWMEALVLAAALGVGVTLGGIRGWATPIHVDPFSGRVQTQLSLAMVSVLGATIAARFAARYSLRSGGFVGLTAISTSALALLALGAVGARQGLIYFKARRIARASTRSHGETVGTQSNDASDLAS